ncbi:DUF3039 domain-containing protein [Streptomyces sp. SS7]
MKKWTPSKNPEKYPVCPERRQIWESHQGGVAP